MKSSLSQLSQISPGLYRVFWKDGGYSMAAIGVTAKGGRWLAPINWVNPDSSAKSWSGVDRLELVDEAETKSKLKAVEANNKELCAALKAAGEKRDTAVYLLGCAIDDAFDCSDRLSPAENVLRLMRTIKQTLRRIS
jgi:hypothetical protein